MDEKRRLAAEVQAEAGLEEDDADGDRDHGGDQVLARVRDSLSTASGSPANGSIINAVRSRRFRRTPERVQAPPHGEHAQAVQDEPDTYE